MQQRSLELLSLGRTTLLLLFFLQETAVQRDAAVLQLCTAVRLLVVV